MAILRQVAFVPSEDECQSLADLRSPFEVWQLPRSYGNLPQICFLRDGKGKWFSINSKCEDVEFKFECVGLAIQPLHEMPDDLAHASRTVLQPEELMAVFRAEWLRPVASDPGDDDWRRVTQDLSAVENLPTQRLTGCLSWAGLLFGSPQSFAGLIYLDDFPLSIGFTSDSQQIESFLSKSRAITCTKVHQWIRKLSGWEIRCIG